MNSLEKFSFLAQGLDHPEGVAWGGDGRLFAGGEAGQIYSIQLEDGSVSEVARTGGFLLCVALDSDGRVYACDMGRNEVVRADPGTGDVQIYSSGTQDEPMLCPNYCAFADDGSLYVTASANWKQDDGAIYKVHPGGGTEVWSRAANSFPNGCAMNPAGDALYVVESVVPHLSRIPIKKDGSAGRLERVALLEGTVPDGVCVDEAGDVYVSCYRPDRIYRVSQTGSVDVLADDPEGQVLNQPTNMAFVGDQLDRMAVANLGGWHIAIADIGVRGLPVRRPSVP
jgi:sugar lactone lactonase YvrE